MSKTNFRWHFLPFQINTKFFFQNIFTKWPPAPILVWMSEIHFRSQPFYVCKYKSNHLLFFNIQNIIMEILTGPFSVNMQFCCPEEWEYSTRHSRVEYSHYESIFP